MRLDLPLYQTENQSNAASNCERNTLSEQAFCTCQKIINTDLMSRSDRFGNYQPVIWHHFSLFIFGFFALYSLNQNRASSEIQKQKLGCAEDLYYTNALSIF